MSTDARTQSPGGSGGLHALVDQALAQRSVPADEAYRRRLVRTLERLQAAGQAALAASGDTSDGTGDTDPIDTSDGTDHTSATASSQAAAFDTALKTFAT